MKRTLIILLVIALAFCTMAASCDPGPDGGGDWNGNDGSPLDNAYATATYGAEQWHAQLTALAETPEP